MKKLLYLFLLFFLVHTAFISFDGLIDDEVHADVALVLGNKVNEDGTLSDRLESRCEKALELYNNGKVNFIVVSGGVGNEGFSEADKMKYYFLKNGVPDSLVLCDNRGDNTESTVKNFVQLNQYRKFSSLIVVSQFYHITRTKKMLRDKEVQNVFGVSPFYFEWRDFYSVLREFFAFYWYLLSSML